MKTKRTKLEDMKLTHNNFPKFSVIPKNIFNIFITSLEAEIRNYYKKDNNKS